MLKNFSFKWYKNEKYREPMERVNSVTVSNAPADTAQAAKAATEIFIRHFGNLKQNTIISIQEYDENGPIGEPIIPADENSIIPTKKAV
jgi:hypothetical protein